MSLKDQILAADDLQSEDVEVPEWSLTLQVRGLTGTQRDSFEAKMVALRKGGQDVELRLADYRSKLLVKCLYDPATGERVFEDKDVQKLGAKSGAVIERLFDVARKLSGMDAEALEAAKGNSKAAPSAASTSD